MKCKRLFHFECQHIEYKTHHFYFYQLFLNLYLPCLFPKLNLRKNAMTLFLFFIWKKAGQCACRHNISLNGGGLDPTSALKLLLCFILHLLLQPLLDLYFRSNADAYFKALLRPFILLQHLRSSPKVQFYLICKLDLQIKYNFSKKSFCVKSRTAQT